MDDTLKPAIRLANGQFGVGHHGGPGKKKMDPVVREMLECATPKAVQRLVECLDAEQYVGDPAIAVPDWRTRMTAAEKILDRLYGKPSQAITDEDGGPIRFGVVVLPPHEQ